MTIDLHTHTTRSDGHLAPADLARLLADRGVAVAAITDHDSVEGVAEAFAAAEDRPGLRLIAGVEISASHPARPDSDVHILGYFMDCGNEAFLRRLADLRDEREERGKRMVAKLAALGYPLDWERVAALAEGASVGRPHVAQAMVERGYLADYKDAFNGLLNNGGEAFVGREGLTLEDAARAIREAGGVAALAHPLYVEERETIIPRLRGMGIDGIEAHYAHYGPDEQQGLLDLARRWELVPCGGSDYHATGRADEPLPGADGPPPDALAALERLAAAG